MLVNLDHLPNFQGENEQYVKPPPGDVVMVEFDVIKIGTQSWYISMLDACLTWWDILSEGSS